MAKSVSGSPVIGMDIEEPWVMAWCISIDAALWAGGVDRVGCCAQAVDPSNEPAISTMQASAVGLFMVGLLGRYRSVCSPSHADGMKLFVSLDSGPRSRPQTGVRPHSGAFGCRSDNLPSTPTFLSTPCGIT